MNNKVSILVPVYNAEQYLPQCLDSIINQTYYDLQIVLIDDGSKDNSLAVCQEYAAKDSRIEVYHQKNQGVATTRNHLLEKVKGDYVLFVDSDDWIEPDMVEFLVKNAENKDADIVKCKMAINEPTVNREPSRIECWEKDNAVKEFLRHTTFRGSLCDKLIKASLLDGLCFNNEISYGEDALFVWHALQKSKIIVVSERQLYHYRMNETSISHQSFGVKKLTGHHTWTIIYKETKQWWPQYLYIAQARFGLEDMYLLRQASQSGYRKNNEIEILQRTVNEFIPQIKQCDFIGLKDTIYAHIICRWYGFGSIYYQLHLLIKKQ